MTLGIIRAAFACTLLSMAAIANAGFSVEGLPALSSERGSMGAHDPYEKPAFAAFRVNEVRSERRKPVIRDGELLVDLAYKPVTQRGTGHADVVDGYGDDVPFTTAMKMVLPTGWQLYREKSLAAKDVPNTVSFIGGRAWPEILTKVGDRYALRFHIDWYDRVVMMSKGRAGTTYEASRVRVIAEPAPKVVVAKAKPVPAPIKTTVSTVTPKTAGNNPDLKISASKLTSSVKISPPKKPSPPPEYSLLVLKGTLHQNIVRISKANGWNQPEWNIDGDYRVQDDYTIKARSFDEAVVKLLLLHPVEADVNLNQRKISVLKEIF